MTARPTYIVHLQPTPDCTDPTKALRELLKRALRSWGLRCVQMPFTPSELCLWLKSSDENLDAIATLLTSGDIKLVECVGGSTVLRTHSNIVSYYEVGSAPILPTAHE
jgi:hypothetical protein